MTVTGTVLVLSDPGDSTADAVVAELIGRGTPIARTDLGDFPLRMSMQAQLGQGRWQGDFSAVDQTVELANVRAVYYRRPTRFTFPDGMSEADTIFAAAEAQLGLGGVLAALDVLWVNDPIRVAFAEYKPVQLRFAADSGLSVPRTLVTNDHRAAQEFAAEVGGPIVCKTLSSLVLSEGGQHRITYTTLLDPATIDPDLLAATAHLLQEWIPTAPRRAGDHGRRTAVRGRDPRRHRRGTDRLAG